MATKGRTWRSEESIDRHLEDAGASASDPEAIDPMRILVVGNYFPPWRRGCRDIRLQRMQAPAKTRPSSPRDLRKSALGIQFVDRVRVERLRVAGTLYGTPIMPELLLRLAHEPDDIIHANFPTMLSYRNSEEYLVSSHGTTISPLSHVRQAF